MRVSYRPTALEGSSAKALSADEAARDASAHPDLLAMPITSIGIKGA